MYRDNSLIPSEAIRLLALGLLADGARSYAALAGEVRHFVSHVTGPSLELVAPPLELLKVEGLVVGDDDALDLSPAGRAELLRLLAANVRAPVSDINKLIIALKMRFLHLLPSDEQRLQAEVLAELSARELARLSELRAHHAGAAGHLIAWLDQEIAQVERRHAFFQTLVDRLA